MTAKNAQEAEEWASKTINDIVLSFYRKESGAEEFNSFFQWKQKGFSVKKGEKAYLLWAKKRNATAKIEVKENEEPQEDDYMFYPLAYVFSNKQVEEITEPEPEQEEIEEFAEMEQYE